MTAMQAASEVDPCATGRKTLLAAPSAGWDGHHPVEVVADRFGAHAAMLPGERETAFVGYTRSIGSTHCARQPGASNGLPK